MPKYYFVVRHGDQVAHHSDGIELPDMSAVLMEVTKSTGELLRELNSPIEAGMADGSCRRGSQGPS
jgi:hypothetical protein